MGVCTRVPAQSSGGPGDARASWGQQMAGTSSAVGSKRVDIPRQYIIDENNRRIGVQLDIDTFERIEEALENHGLTLLIQAVADDESVDLEEAKALYREHQDEPVWVRYKKHFLKELAKLSGRRPCVPAGDHPS
jgi:MFS superfamily sulfate permease-like transporter